MSLFADESSVHARAVIIRNVVVVHGVVRATTTAKDAENQATDSDGSNTEGGGHGCRHREGDKQKIGDDEDGHRASFLL